MPITTTAKSLKVTAVIDAAPFEGFAIPPGAKPVVAITVGERVYRCELNPKSLRKAVALLDEHEPANVVLIVQGKLNGTVIEEAGIAATVRLAPAEAA